MAHGGEAVSVLQYLTTSQFWYELLQNWQNEFLAVGMIVVLFRLSAAQEVTGVQTSCRPPQSNRKLMA